MTVISALGQPLNAEIELLSTTPEELASLSARIAPSEVFEAQGIEKASALSGVFVQVGKRPDGTPVLRLKSSQPINEPFLDMLIQVEWSSGRLLREYTALLDPPGYGDQPLVPVAAVPSTEAVQTAPVPGGPAEKAAAGPKARAMAATLPEEGAGTYTVRKGDTLRAIAVQNQIEGVSLEQMLVGLYRANPEAFMGNNMNRLKVGKIVRVPSQEELQAIDQQEAVREIRVQAADWNAYRNKLAGLVAEAAAVSEEAPAQAATGKIAAAEDKSMPPPPPGPRDVVKLSKSEGAATRAESADIAAKLSALQEEITAREKAIKEAEARVAALEKQLQDVQKLLEIKNKTLAEAQQAAKPAEPASAKPPAKPEAPPQPAAQPSEAPKPPPTAQKPVPAKPQPKQPQSAPPPAEEPGLLDGLLGNPLLLGGGVGLLALLGGAWFYVRNKRRKGLDTFEQGILTSGGIKPNTVFGNTAGGTVDTGSTAFLTDFGQGTTTGMIDTNEVDPIAEAEVYMAYGRDAQAEEILKDAIGKDPKRYELHLKLLEIYLARKDVSAFETIAGEMYAALGPNDPTWAKVVELGRKLEPDNPLYGGGGAAPQAAPQTEPAVEDFTATMIQQSTAAAEAPVVDVGTPEPEPVLDFTLDDVGAAPETAAPAPAESGLDLDLGSLELPEQAPAVEAAEETLPDLGTALPELELPGAGPAPETSEAAQQVTEGGLDLPLELPESPAEGTVQLDVTDIGIEPLPELAALETAPPSEQALPEAPELPSLEPQPSAPAAPPAEDSLELPALDIALDEAPPAPAQAQDVEMIELDLPALETPAEPQSTGLEEVALELPDETAAAGPVAAPTAAGGSAPETAGLDIDLDLDVDLGEPAAQAQAAQTETDTPAAPPLADLDLSGISLEMEEGASTTAEPAEQITLGDATAESPEVDTKLDLVTAYIDMGDHEGARELLQEVLREGGPRQREKAQKLLNDLG